MIDEKTLRTEITTLMTKIPKFIDKENSTHIIVFGYVRECLRVYRKCISINFLDETSMEALSIDYYSYLNCIYATDKVLFTTCVNYLHIILSNLMNILETNQLFESCKNLQLVLEIIDENKNKK